MSRLKQLRNFKLGILELYLAERSMLATPASTYKVEHRCRHIVCSVRKLPKIFADSWLMSFASLFIYMTFL